MSLFVKLCGLCREEDVRAAVAAGPDAIGFVFWPGSARAVKAGQVAAWTKGVAGPVRVGVFVDQPVDEVCAAVEAAGLDVVQLHGKEDAAYICALGLPRVWKALHLDRLPEDWADLPVEAFLLDSGTAEMPGGTGLRVETERAEIFVANSPRPVLLAGGLTPGNVAEAVGEVKPWGVDVSSGVERAKGVKDAEALRAFVENARSLPA